MGDCNPSSQIGIAHNEGINVLRLFPLCQDDIKIKRKGKIEVLQKGQKMLQKVQNEYFK
jgi:hypothetical protein